MSSEFWGAATSIGKRETQQDEYLAVEDLFEGTPRTSLFAVFDGHGAVFFLKLPFLRTLKKTLNNNKNQKNKTNQKGSEGHRVSAFVKKIFPEVLIKLRSQLIGQSAEAATALKEAFEIVNTRLIENEAIDTYMSGTTAVLLLFFHDERRVLIGNVGDSRIMMGRKEGDDVVPMQVSTDHTCLHETEVERVKKAGGRIDQMHTEDGHDGPLRIYKGTLPYPGLVVTRSLGDTCATKLGVLAEPEVIERELSKKDIFFVLASDGLWDGLDMVEVVRLAVKYENPQKASDILNKRALKSLDAKRIDDNVTNIVVHTG
ncbi:phosphatase 2C-like domain-containing protein [Obelidium mucronatum]|nr:phosphatase 2C-like domain-containing protein [Obelidium mucronatum]